jgi:hypothetical protein
MAVAIEINYNAKGGGAMTTNINCSGGRTRINGTGLKNQHGAIVVAR